MGHDAVTALVDGTARIPGPDQGDGCGDGGFAHLTGPRPDAAQVPSSLPATVADGRLGWREGARLGGQEKEVASARFSHMAQRPVLAVGEVGQDNDLAAAEMGAEGARMTMILAGMASAPSGDAAPPGMGAATG